MSSKRKDAPPPRLGRGLAALLGDRGPDTDPIRPDITDEDRAYLLEAISFMFPDVSVTEADIESGWSGVRPLIYEEGKDPSEISRKDEIWRDWKVL